MTRKRKPAALLRAADGHQELLEKVAAEYGVEPGSDQADHIATLIVLRKAIRDRAWRGDPIRTDPDDLGKIDDVLKSYRPKDEGLRIEVNYVEGCTGTYVCQHCHQRNDIPDGDYTPERTGRREPPVIEAAPVAAPSTATAKPADNAVELGGRLHYGSDNGGFMGAVYAPAVGDTAAGLPFNDPHPYRR
jgi:hypothetical protein